MPIDVATLTLLAGLCVVLITILLARPQLTRHTVGKVLAFSVFLPLPLLVSWVGTTDHMEHAKSTEFCVSCHEMESYGRSLHIDDSDYLPATHYQNNYIPRDQACFTCHTSYTMYGDIEAKIRGLRHVWVHFTRQVPETIELYEPYQNRECLHCHGGARAFEANEMHADDLEDLRANEISCLECHEWIHDVGSLGEHDFWEPDA